MGIVSHLKKCLLLVSSRGAIPHLIRLVLTILFLIIVNRSITFQDIRNLIVQIDLTTLFLCVFSGAAIIAVQSLRWSIVLRSFEVRSSFVIALKTLLWGNILAFVTPGRAGELLRGIDLDPARKALLISASLADRLLSITPVIVSAIPVLFISNFYLHQRSPVYFNILISIAFVCLIFSVIVVWFPDRCWWKLPTRFSVTVKQVAVSVKKMNMFNSICLSFIIHAILVVQTMLLFRVFGMERWLDNCYVAILSYAFMLCVPVSIANIGIREYAFGLFGALTYVTIPGQQSVTVASFGVSSLILVINIIIPALIGLVWNLLPSRKDKNSEKVVSEMYNSSIKKVNSDATWKV